MLNTVKKMLTFPALDVTLETSASSYSTVFNTLPTSTFGWYNPLLYSFWWLGIFHILFGATVFRSFNHVPGCKQIQRSGWDGLLNSLEHFLLPFPRKLPRTPMGKTHESSRVYPKFQQKWRVCVNIFFWLKPRHLTVVCMLALNWTFVAFFSR